MGEVQYRAEDEAAVRGNTRRGFLSGAAAGGAVQLIARALPAGSALAAAGKPCEATGPGMRTAAIAVSPDGRTVWTADNAARTITAYRSSDLTPGRSIDVGGAPLSIAISPDGTRALVTTAFYDRPGLAIADLHNGQVERVDVGAEPHAVAFAPNGRTAYVAGGGKDGVLRRVDVRTGHVHAPIALGRYPRGLAIAPDGRHALVALNGDATVAVVALAKNRVARRIKTPAFPSQLAISPNSERALVTHGGFGSRHATPLDLVKWHAGHAIRTGLDPCGVAFDRSGRVAMIANVGSGSVALVDPRTGRRRRTLKPGGAPRAVVAAGSRGFVVDGLTGRLTSIRLGSR
jgi:DNA-binding beta-propeller fold protein YncE